MIYQKRFPVVLFVLFISIFFIIELPGLSHYDPGDEHAYFYMGKLAAEGKIPYRDFFYAHPPIQVGIIGFLYSIFGFNIAVFKLVPLISTIISSILLFLLIRKSFGLWEALAVASLFLFSYRVILEATYFLGVNLTTLFVVFSIFLLYSKKPVWSGIVAGFASLTGLYALVPTAGVFIILFLKNKKLFYHFSLGFIGIFGIINLIFILFIPGFFLQVYWYHILKPSLPGNTFSVFSSAVRQHYLIIFLSIFGIFSHSKKKLLLPAFIVVLYVIFLSIVRLFNFYFVLLFPFLGIIAGIGLVDMSKRISLRYKFIFAGILFFLFTFSLYSTVVYLHSFDFVDFESKGEIVNFIKENSEEDDVIFGDVMIVPLLALLTERRIAFDFVDTNAMRFLSGLADFEEVLERLKKERVRFVVVRPNEGFGNSVIVRDFLVEKCYLSFDVKDRHWGDIFIYDCSKTP